MTDFEINLKQVLDSVIQKQVECARMMARILLEENTRLNNVRIQKIAQLIESFPTGCPQKIMDELKELLNDEEIGI